MLLGNSVDNELMDLNPEGLFGGLMSELRRNEAQLVDHVKKSWRLHDVESLQDLGKWRRGGAETYIAEANVCCSDGAEIKVIAKAFVGTGLKPTDQQERWLARRTILSSKGIKVPRLYAEYPGMIVEEFVDHDPHAIETMEIAFQLGQIASVMLAERFHPVGMIGDTRFDEGRVYYIDFGSDLGGTGQSDDDGWLSSVRSKFSDEVRKDFEEGLRIGFGSLN